MLHLQLIDKDWTLFLDRDGVINYEKEADYIRNPGEFRFYEGVPEAIKIFAQKFGRIFVVTNQKGIGKGLMTEKDLKDIHDFMMTAIIQQGGRIDHIYFC
ncbi:MAG: HAD-IIIA family hydrolase, partial [Chitinophagaceae bacterium]